MWTAPTVDVTWPTAAGSGMAVMMASRTVPSMSLSAGREGRDLCRTRRDDEMAASPWASEVVDQQCAQDVPVVRVEAGAEQVLDVRIVEEICIFQQEADLGGEEGL